MRRALAVFGAFLGAACASQAPIVRQYQEMRPAMVSGRWGEAVTSLERAQGSIYREKDRVAYWLNLGTAQHYAGDFDASMEAFVSAEEAMRDLWTKSITGQASKVLVNETSVAYPGEDFERILLYLYTSLNRVKQGRLQDALVEARRADEELKRMQIVYQQADDLSSVYTRDAFMLWLVGLFYEIEGSFNDAYLAYQASEKAYARLYGRRFGVRSPSFLEEDIYRAGVMAGLVDEKRGGRAGTLSHLRDGWGEVVVIHGNGEAPFKRELSFTTATADGQVVRVALPELVQRPHQVDVVELEAGGTIARSELAEPVSRIAMAQFQHQLPAIKARAAARAIIKYAAVKAASSAVKGGRDASSERQVAGALLGLIGSIATASMEAADLRAWTVLPAEFGVARLWLPAGEHTLDIRYLGPDGRVLEQDEPRTIQLGSNERRLIHVRSIR